MQPHVGPAISSAVRTASRGESDASVRIVGTGIALGLVALVAHAVGREAQASSKRRRVQP